MNDLKQRCLQYMHNSLMKSYKVRVLLTIQCFNASAVSSTRAQRRAENQLSTAPMVSLTHILTHITTQFIHTLARSLSRYYMPVASLCTQSSFFSLVIFHDHQSCLLRAPSLKLQIHPFLHPPAVTSLHIKPCSKITVET